MSFATDPLSKNQWSLLYSSTIRTWCNNSDQTQFPAEGSNQCFFICFSRIKKYSTPKFFAPFGGDFGDFGPVLNQNAFEINHFCAPQAKILNILRLKNDFSFIFRCIFWKIPKFSDFFSRDYFFKFSRIKNFWNFFVLNKKKTLRRISLGFDLSTVCCASGMVVVRWDYFVPEIIHNHFENPHEREVFKSKILLSNW